MGWGEAKPRQRQIHKDAPIFTELGSQSASTWQQSCKKIGRIIVNEKR